MTRSDLTLIIMGVAAGMVGFTLARAPLQAALERARADHATYRASVAETHKLQALAAARALQAEQANSRGLQLRLARQLSAINRLKEQRHAQAIRTTTGRACLSADTVRVLNTPATDRAAAAADLPAAASRAAATDAPGTAAPAAAAQSLTDTDVAAWVADAQARYATCAARLNTLTEWAATRPNTAP